MRRSLAVVVSVLVILGSLAPAAFAQAPAPKVTINGLVDFVTSVYKNWSGAGCPAGCDVTDGGADEGWYSRERGVFTLTGEVGKSKGVWAVELDFTNGFVGTPAAGGGSATTFPGTSAGADLDTDLAGFVETKWLYVETPITGPGSLLPFIPVASTGRFGLQPARGHEYKNGILWAGDFPGANLETQWAPNLKSTVTYAQTREQLDDTITGPGNPALESWVFLVSVEFEVFKGLTVKPTYAYASFDGGSGNGSLGRPAVNGFNPNGVQLQTSRHTIGGDVRWTAGPFTLQPTLLAQFGTQDIVPTTANPGVDEVDIWAWIFDTTAGFRAGPLNIEGRVMYTPGMSAMRQVQAGSDVGYYTPANPGFGYMAGWTEIQTSGVDYITAMNAGAPGLSLRTAPSYDKYGRLFIAGALDYALTPALTFKSVVNVSWTDQEVDTDGVLGATGMTNVSKGDADYIGTEVNAGFTYRFAPNVAFDLMGAILFAGEALDHKRTAAEPSPHDADNIYKGVARVRFTF